MKKVDIKLEEETMEERVVARALRALGAPEYDKKSIVLTNFNDRKKRVDILNELNDAVSNGEKSEYIEMLLLPWDKFIDKYYGQFEGYDRYKDDKAFAYKLYAGSDKVLRAVDSTIKNGINPDQRTLDRYSKLNNCDYNFASMINDKNFTLDDLCNYVSKNYKLEHNTINNMLIRLVYILKYVNSEKAKEMNFKKYHISDEYRGFDLEGKMNLYNKVPRKVLEYKLGLVDGKTYSCEEISKMLNVPVTQVKSLCDKNISKLLYPTESLKHSLQIKDYGENTNDEHIYGEKGIRDNDFNLNYAYYYNKIDDETKKALNEEEEPVFMKRLYVLSRYMYSSDRKLAYMLGRHADVIAEIKALNNIPVYSNEKDKTIK